MDAFIARQPIFDSQCRVYAYELLYRDASRRNAANIVDGTAATKRVLSDAVTLFGLPYLTNSKPAFVNFTEKLLLEDFALLADAKDIVIEILEDVQVTPQLLDKLTGLKNQGYKLALDDYTGDPAFDPLLPLVDVVKVDFMLTDEATRQRIADRIIGSYCLHLLAEKVETGEEFYWAKEAGYTLFQGYFFQKPEMMTKTTHSFSMITFSRLLLEVQKDEIDFSKCADIIRSDAVLTYRLIQRVSTMRFYRGNVVTSISQALMLLGSEELRRWLFLLLARENNVTRSDETIRAAYLRGLFAELLMRNSIHDKHSGDAFILGMFSMLDRVLGQSLESLLEEITLPKGVANALLGTEENAFSHLLEYLLVYEMQNPDLTPPDIGLKISEEEVAKSYMKCIHETDIAFASMQEDVPSEVRKKK